MKTLGLENLKFVRESGKPVLLIVWHGRMLVPVWQQSYKNIVAMISQHRDGEMVSRLVEHLGYNTVRGSSTRGGSEAALELLRLMKSGAEAAMICDGPRGPIYKMKPGTPFLALQAGAYIVPTCFAAKKCWTFHSWDRFTVPKPFSKVVLLWGEPIPPRDPSTSLKDFTKELEDILNQLKEKAEQIVETL